jgi:hypothetical protein
MLEDVNPLPCHLSSLDPDTVRLLWQAISVPLEYETEMLTTMPEYFILVLLNI